MMLPVGDKTFLPDRPPWKYLEIFNIRHSTSRSVHHIQSRCVQLPSHFQPKELLHFLNFILHDVPIDFHFCHWSCFHLEAIKVCQISLEKIHLLTHHFMQKDFCQSSVFITQLHTDAFLRQGFWPFWRVTQFF